MTWRYQPVWIEDPDGSTVFGLCEVYFDDAGKLSAWTEEYAMAPGGDTLDDMRGEISQMFADAYKWRPVRFVDIHVGMTFDRAITQDEAEALADTIDRYGAAFQLVGDGKLS